MKKQKVTASKKRVYESSCNWRGIVDTLNIAVNIIEI